MTADPALLPRPGRGRPRASGANRPGVSTRQEILDAAADLFRSQGYEETTTRQIADRVGIKQSSLYYHFADKRSIVVELLADSVSPSLAFADWVADQPVSPTVRLFALATYDVQVVLSASQSIRTVFHMPGADEPQREGIRRGLDPLHERYRDFALQALAITRPEGSHEGDVDLVFGLVESIVSQRYWGEPESREAYGRSIARGCLRLVGVSESQIEKDQTSAAEVIGRYGAGGLHHVESSR